MGAVSPRSRKFINLSTSYSILDLPFHRQPEHCVLLPPSPPGSGPRRSRRRGRTLHTAGPGNDTHRPASDQGRGRCLGRPGRGCGPPPPAGTAGGKPPGPAAACGRWTPPGRRSFLQGPPPSPGSPGRRWRPAPGPGRIPPPAGR